MDQDWRHNGVRISRVRARLGRSRARMGHARQFLCHFDPLFGAASGPPPLATWRGIPLLLLMGVMITSPANNFERHMLPLTFVFCFVALTTGRVEGCHETRIAGPEDSAGGHHRTLNRAGLGWHYGFLFLHAPELGSDRKDLLDMLWPVSPCVGRRCAERDRPADVAGTGVVGTTDETAGTAEHPHC